MLFGVAVVALVGSVDDDFVVAVFAVVAVVVVVELVVVVVVFFVCVVVHWSDGIDNDKQNLLPRVVFVLDLLRESYINYDEPPCGHCTRPASGISEKSHLVGVIRARVG